MKLAELAVELASMSIVDACLQCGIGANHTTLAAIGAVISNVTRSIRNAEGAEKAGGPVRAIHQPML